MTVLAWLCLVLAGLPLLLALDNLRRYRLPSPASSLTTLSVLIPARDEALNIVGAVSSILASTDVALELIVLDDGSSDGTSEILQAIKDDRLRILTGAKLPSGWSGKQRACARLAEEATSGLLVFVDADVRLAPDALSRMAGFMERNDVGLASGFPRQITQSWAEMLLLPLIHFLLLAYLPIARMQSSVAPSLGAGCGQLFIAKRADYFRAGGHGAIRASLHDGVMLPRAFRRAGIMTGLFDAGPLATCRMYHSASEVWEGLTKNATEGMAKPFALPVWTIILGGGQVLPAVLMLAAPSATAAGALACGIVLRLILARRFRQPLISALFHPVGVLGLLVLQWAALLRAASGRPATWRGRAYPAQT